MTQLSDLEFLKLSKGQKFGYKISRFFTGIPKAILHFFLKIWEFLKKGFEPFVDNFLSFADYIFRQFAFRNAPRHHGDLPGFVLVGNPAEQDNENNDPDQQTDRQADQALVHCLVRDQESAYAQPSENQQRQEIPAQPAQ